jgi:hypothetical protein
VKRSLSVFLGALFLVVCSPASAQTKVLFDAMHAQTAGNADWVLDEDVCGTAQRFPTPAQSGVISSTAENYWNGAFSAFGVDLVKKGYLLESLPVGSRLTYGDGTNAQDLSNYKIFVSGEPNTRFTAAEITAIRSFVQNGGGLFMIGDHANSDRNNDGWDSPEIFNELAGTLFGITFGADPANANHWFNDNPNANYTNDATSPILFTGPYGVATAGRGLGLFGSTTMTLSTANNPSAKGHIWKTGATINTATLVTFATATYGSGRVAAIGDSSPVEDITNSCGHTTHTGYDASTFDNRIILSNAVAWLAGGSGGGDTTLPATSITAPLAGATVSGTTTVTASASDNVGVTKVEFNLDGVLQSTDTSSPYSWSWNTVGATNGSHSLTSKAFDAAGNTRTSTAVSVTVSNTALPTDVSNWKIVQANSAITFNIPAGTSIPANGYLVVGRNATKAQFQTFWGVTLGANVVYVDGLGAFPQINGSETYTLRNASSTLIEGPTIAMDAAAGRSIRRINPCVAPGTVSNWTNGVWSTSTPGSGAAAGCAKGVVINEMGDALGTNAFNYEFVELHNDK